MTTEKFTSYFCRLGEIEINILKMELGILDSITETMLLNECFINDLQAELEGLK